MEGSRCFWELGGGRVETFRGLDETRLRQGGAVIGWVIFAVFVVVLTIAAQRAASSRTEPGMIDLTSVRDAVMEKHGWTGERAEAAEAEYVRFLTLLQMRPGFMLVPWMDGEGRDDLDQFWHQHILDTAKYEADCKAMFGRMIHHNPHVVRGSEVEQEAVDKTRRLYERTFGSGTYGSASDPVFVSGCSACAAATSHGWSDGGHSGHDGGSGGHGCGGHGCGHGCGGH